MAVRHQELNSSCNYRTILEIFLQTSTIKLRHGRNREVGWDIITYPDPT